VPLCKVQITTYGSFVTPRGGLLQRQTTQADQERTMDLARTTGAVVLLAALAAPVPALAGGDDGQYGHAHDAHHRDARDAATGAYRQGDDAYWAARFGTWTPENPTPDISDREIAQRYGWAYRPDVIDAEYWARVDRGEIREGERD